MTQAEGEAPERSVSCCTVFCHVSLARVCLTWRRTRPARRRTTAASCGRAPRATPRQTPDTRCPCATHDRYSSALTKRIIRTPELDAHGPRAAPLRYHLIFFIFTLISFTLLHDLWFAHERLVMVFCLTVMDCAFVTPVVTRSTMRYGLRSGFGVTKTQSNRYNVVCLMPMYCIFVALIHWDFSTDL